MNKLMIATLVSTLTISSAAFADGLSGTLEIPVLPGFGINGALNYNVESPTGLVSGGSLLVSTSGGTFNLGVRGATKYAQELFNDGQAKIDGYVGVGANVFIVPTFVTNVDASAGLKFKYSVSPNARLYGDADFVANYLTATNTFVPFIGGDLGIKFDVSPNTDIYVQGTLGQYLNNSPLGYDIRVAGYYGISPEVKLGGSVGYGNMYYAPFGQPSFTSISPAGGVSVRFGLQYTEKPNTIGTPGSHLP